MYAGMVELADTLDLGSSAKAWEFKSPYPHQNPVTAGISGLQGFLYSITKD